MQRKPFFWATISLLCLAGAVFFWHRGEQRQVVKVAPAINAIASQPIPTAVAPVSLSPQIAAVKPAIAPVIAANAKSKKPFAYRLHNTDEPLDKLIHNDHAILLANALLDTTKPLDVTIPDRLRAPANNGSYIVQARGPLDNNFRALLLNANATVVSYIPNNAYLVRVSDAGAQQISASSQAQTVLPYEPYYKLDAALLQLNLDHPQALPPSGALNVLMFSDEAQTALGQLQQLGATVVGQDRSPFGPVYKVTIQPGTLAAVASLPGVQGVSTWSQRTTANDMERVSLGVTTNTLPTATNYLGLSGKNVVVNINDTGVDAAHPDLTNRITSDFAFTLADANGHGTHVAGTILGNGSKSLTVTNAQGSIKPYDFRGMATNATAFVISLFNPDFYLQETAAKQPNVFISNNSWTYANPSYDIAAASYDAAVRDALPEVTGSQPILYVFAAGNIGGASDTGGGGTSDTIQSPATAKNVITVGATEEHRSITNQVVVDGITNSEIANATDDPTQVASFSSRGNVGVNIESSFGRFKPDVVAPGTFVISDRSQQWDTNTYYNPTNNNFTTYPNQIIQTNTITPFLFPVDSGVIKIVITVVTNSQTMVSNLAQIFPIYVNVNDFPDDTTPFGTNSIVLTPSTTPSIHDFDTLYFDITNTSTHALNVDVQIEEITTNDVGNYYSVLSDLNQQVAPWYRYESGTSMSAAAVSGMLALMEEYFKTTLGIQPSPALMKALVINGSRSISDNYNFITRNSAAATAEGWGMPNLPNILPASPGTGTPTNGVIFFDQDPTTALATGQSQSRTIALSTNAAANDLRVTLVWTDPPGNPVAGIKLVNDLDLIVSNTATHEVFYGNDFGPDGPYVEASTNGTPNIDSVNNVENVYLQGPLDGSSYVVTVLARRVNVNAVTANNTAIVQDYALVISSGSSNSVSNAFSSISAAAIANNSPAVTNFFAITNGLPIFNQRVGANSQFSGSTNGTLSQWNFYIFTNMPPATNADQANFTNVAFFTFGPPNLGVPRMGASSETGPPDSDATRYLGADVDLYVSTDPGLTNLTPAAVAAANKSVGRTGTEVVFFTNSVPGEIYYVAVKSEDQQAAQYNFIGFSTDVPFSQTGSNGQQIINMNPVPLTIQPGTPTQPSTNLLFGICLGQGQIRKATVQLSVAAQDFGDYIGAVSSGTNTVVLHSHSFFTNSSDASETFNYDDSGEDPQATPSSGPGSLRGFTGQNMQGSAWFYTVVNDSSLLDTGSITTMKITLDPQPTGNTFSETIHGMSWFYDFVDIPADATNFTVTVTTTSGSGPLQLYVKQGDFPSFSSFDEFETLTSGTGAISVNKFSNPPLNEGRYFFGIFNSSSADTTVTITIEVDRSLNPAQVNTYRSIGNEAILDDAVTYSTNTVGQNSTVAAAEVGVRIDHPRESDLVLTLISPMGTRVLLAENRGETDSNGYGSGVDITNTIAATVSGGIAANTNTVGTTNFGTLGIQYNFFTVPDDMRIFYDGAQIFDTGLISGSGSFTVDFGPGISTNVEIVMNQPGSNPFGTSGDAWTYTGSIIQRNVSYAFFTENTNLTQLPIKFAVPPFGQGAAFIAPTNLLTSSFESNAAGLYTTTVEGWTVVNTNPVTVVTVPQLADSGTNVLALHAGGITRILPTVDGLSYTLRYVNRGRPALTPVSWWKAETNNFFTDSAGNNTLSNAGSTVTNGPGEVGAAFVLSGVGTRLKAVNSPSLDFTTAMTAEAWINPANAASGTAQTIIARSNAPANVSYALYLDGAGKLNFSASIDGTVAGTKTATSTGVITSGVWTHVAGTFDGANLNVYVNGTLQGSIALGGNIFAGIADLGIGGTYDTVAPVDRPFTGLIDEASVYNTALTITNIQDIYAAGSAGKDPVDSTPAVTAFVVLGGNTNIISGLDQWRTNSFTFVATSANMVLTITPNTNLDGSIQDGNILDSFTLEQNAQPNPANYYLPEESLAKLIGEPAQGNWRLEVLDNRVGATNPQPDLVSWQLNLQLTDKFPLSSPLQNGMAQTNTVPPNTTAYYAVSVPPWAGFATNVLVTSDNPVNVLFNQNVQPTSLTTNVTLINNATTGTSTLSLTGNPPLIPGQTYFIGIQNSSTTTPATFTIRVDFGVPILANAVAVTNSVAASTVPQYFQFNVDPTAVAAQFQILNPSGNLAFFVKKGLPLPNSTNFDYQSIGIGPKSILVVTNVGASQPLSAGPWYLAVFNNDTNAVNFTVLASEAGTPTPIALNSGVAVSGVSLPGIVTSFYSFTIPNNNDAAVLFEIYNLSGNDDLGVQTAFPGYPLGPVLALGNNPGTNAEQIVLRTNAPANIVTNFVMGNVWYLFVTNTTASNINFTVRAIASTNSIVAPGAPPKVTATFPSGGGGPTFNFTGILGSCYEFQYSSDLATWTSFLPPISSTTTSFTFTDPTPTSSGTRFYRVAQVACP